MVTYFAHTQESIHGRTSRPETTDNGRGEEIVTGPSLEIRLCLTTQRLLKTLVNMSVIFIGNKL